MGEKGNVDAASAAVASTAAVGGATLIERTTVSAVETVVDTGQDLAGTIREKGIEAAADGAIAEARERVKRDEEPTDTPPAT